MEPIDLFIMSLWVVMAGVIAVITMVILGAAVREVAGGFAIGFLVAWFTGAVVVLMWIAAIVWAVLIFLGG